MPRPNQAGRQGSSPGADLEPIAIEDERELTAEERARREAEAEERAGREAEATADSDEPETRRKAAEVPADARIQATGKRKSAIARVVLTAGIRRDPGQQQVASTSTSPVRTTRSSLVRRSSPPATSPASTSRSASTVAASPARPARSATASPAR